MPYWPPFWDVVEAEILRREAAALVAGPDATLPADPFAPPGAAP